MGWIVGALMAGTVAGGATYEGVREQYTPDVNYIYDPQYYILGDEKKTD